AHQSFNLANQQRQYLSSSSKPSCHELASSVPRSAGEPLHRRDVDRYGRASESAGVSSAVNAGCTQIVETSIPSRLDALSWSGFHTRVVIALGITWILDGLEVTLAGALSGALKESPKLQFSNFDVGVANSAYLAGAVVGALAFGWLTDRIGRKKLFFITLALYLTAPAA